MSLRATAIRHRFPSIRNAVTATDASMIAISSTWLKSFPSRRMRAVCAPLSCNTAFWDSALGRQRRRRLQEEILTDHPAGSGQSGRSLRVFTEGAEEFQSAFEGP